MSLITLVFCDLLKHTQSSPIRRCQPGIHGYYLAIRGLFIGICGYGKKLIYSCEKKCLSRMPQPDFAYMQCLQFFG